MKEEITNFERKELFEHYNSETNPFLYITTKVDITNIYNNYKNYYPTIAYFITLAANKIDNFKYRCEGNKFYKYNVVRPNFTETFMDMNVGYFVCDLKDNYNEFIEEYNHIKEKCIQTKKSYTSLEQDELWISCLPWFNTTSIITPFDKNVTIPQFFWDKFIFENDKCFVNLTIMAHHGFIDGYHIHLFLTEFNQLINDIKN